MTQELPLAIRRIEKELFLEFLTIVKKNQKHYLLRNDIEIMFRELHSQKNSDEDIEELYCYRFLSNVHEIICWRRDFILLYRHQIARHLLLQYNPQKHHFLEISRKQYLNIRDYMITGTRDGQQTLEIDFLPFYDYSPQVKASELIGDGILYLNKHLSSNLFQNPDQWEERLFDFLCIHQLQGRPLLVNRKKMKNIARLRERLRHMGKYIRENLAKNRPERIYQEMKELGFRIGWGNTPERISETMSLLLHLINAPGPRRLQNFVSRIPMLSKIAIFSPHGWFAQKDVLGKPDTGGQVVYILDQVRYLEKQLAKELEQSGIDIAPQIVIISRLLPENEGTTCNQPREKVEGTNNCWIMRVPFRHKDGSIHPRWVSRFKVWPYLGRFAAEVKELLTQEFKCRPDLLIGNYSDGNMVATMLAKEFGVTQCNIAHALEKSKYIFSDLYWKNMEKNYNFSIQYTADLISMNMASFIITSTFQEIGGTDASYGQYESYTCYSLPGLYHVKNGVNLFHPKFNVIPPGANERFYFPYYNDNREQQQTQSLNQMLFHDEGAFVFGKLAQPERVPLFVMSRLDKIKNVTGLVEAYGRHPELNNIANLIAIAGKVNPDEAQDDEERAEIHRMYQLIEHYRLHDKIRWLGVTLPKGLNGEVYRVIADHRGVFVQPALFEAFGLTVIEAMSCGLPTFATQFGGPSEIIREGEHGFLINPTLPDELAEKIFKFLDACNHDPNLWEKISHQGITRVASAFTWDLYASKLLNLTKLYGFWKYAISQKAKEKMRLYCDLIYDDFIRKRLPKKY